MLAAVLLLVAWCVRFVVELAEKMKKVNCFGELKPADQSRIVASVLIAHYKQVRSVYAGNEELNQLDCRHIPAFKSHN